MSLCHYLTPSNIYILKDVSSKDGILKTLTLELCAQNNIKNGPFLAEAIINREREGSTFLPTGIAIPHARVPDVEEIALVLGIAPEGFKELPDMDPTYLFFLFFSPVKDKEFGRHLKLLSRIAAIFRDPVFVKDVAKTADPDKIFALIQHRERETAE